MNRWCTREAKLNPLWGYEEQTFHLDYRRDERQLIRFIGIDAGEVHRVHASKQKQVKQRYPLIEYNLDRQGCQKLIERKGLALPRKSGCFMCPFAARHELARLSIEYPELFEQALQLEHTVNEAWSCYSRCPSLTRLAAGAHWSTRWLEKLIWWRTEASLNSKPLHAVPARARRIPRFNSPPTPLPISTSTMNHQKHSSSSPWPRRRRQKSAS